MIRGDHLMRLMDLVLGAMAVQFVLNGIGDLWPTIKERRR